VGKKASQAGHECISSKETILRSEDTLEEESDERERLDTWKSSNLEMLCFVGKKIKYIVVTIKDIFCYLLQPSFK
jgi:hypothetical protein